MSQQIEKIDSEVSKLSLSNCNSYLVVIPWGHNECQRTHDQNSLG